MIFSRVVTAIVGLWSTAILTVALSSPAFSDGFTITPQMKLRLTVVEWAPAKGEFEQWTALGGEFVVSQAGTVTLPVIGSIKIGSLDSAGLASEVAKVLQARIGLVNKPEVTVEVVEYPPIYVVGDVSKPGEYPFRSQMTALQALALGGGELKSDRSQSGMEIRIVGELQTIERDLLRSTTRIARLQAEAAGAKDIVFPSMLDSADTELVTEVQKQERTIFTARANELFRQTKSLEELHALLNAEINVLEEKIKAADTGIASAEREFNAVSDLVAKGIAVASRKSDLERALAGYRTDRLDHVTAVMRARQAITEAMRNLDGLRDRQQTEVASELQQERANFDHLKLKQTVSQKLLVDTLAGQRTADSHEPPITFTITRLTDGETAELAATQSTPLMPGDVVQITSGRKGARGDAGSLASTSTSSATTTASEASQ
jgi:protein involved in polysaccharide export with SLBB domain